jgi:acyl-coenzyme A thioesterase PaaI-like protein
VFRLRARASHRPAYPLLQDRRRRDVADRCSWQYSGPPGAAHGGIVAAYLDEVLAAASFRATSRAAVTGELTIRYVKPVPVETPIIGKGSLVADHGRYVDVEGRLEDLGTASVLATAKARFFPIRS